MRSLTVVNVILADREDGGLRVYSDDLPGLILSGRDRATVARQIEPAIRALFEQRGFTSVTVQSTTPIGAVLHQRSPRDVDVHVQHEQFVVELQKEAA